MLVPAPLEGIANPDVSPNPAKAPWYFLGIQELLLHFHPLVGAILIPSLALGCWRAALLRYDPENVGVYFRSCAAATEPAGRRGGLMATPVWVLLDEYVLDWAAWLPSWPSLVTTGLIPLAIVLLGCLAWTSGSTSSFKANPEERILALFVFLFTALIVLTLIGIFFRGAGYGAVLALAMPAH